MSRHHVSASLVSGQVLACDAYLALREGRMPGLTQVLVRDLTCLVSVEEIPLDAFYTVCECSVYLFTIWESEGLTDRHTVQDKSASALQTYWLRLVFSKTVIFIGNFAGAV